MTQNVQAVDYTVIPDKFVLKIGSGGFSDWKTTPTEKKLTLYGKAPENVDNGVYGSHYAAVNTNEGGKLKQSLLKVGESYTVPAGTYFALQGIGIITDALALVE